MIYLKSREEIQHLRDSNRIAAEVMTELSKEVRVGVTTAKLNALAESLIRQRHAEPAFKGYKGYQYALCVAVNEEVVHGIPSNRELKSGDIISLDCGIFYHGFYGDHAWSFAVGEVRPKVQELLKTGEKALDLAIKTATPGNRLYDVSAAIQQCAETAGFSVVRDYVGHGIGKNLHEDPQIPNFGEPGTGIRLRPGLTLALEPMINEGSWEVEVLKDGWTVVTQDRKWSVHFEHTIAITDNGPEILSLV